MFGDVPGRESVDGRVSRLWSTEMRIGEGSWGVGRRSDEGGMEYWILALRGTMIVLEWVEDGA